MSAIYGSTRLFAHPKIVIGMTSADRRLLHDKLVSHRVIDENTDCWLFTGSVGTHGYGQVYFPRAWQGGQGYPVMTHRLAAFLWLDVRLDSETLILHRCDTRRCFNPAHLYAGDKDDNGRDAAARRRIPYGERHWKTKLTLDDVLNIRELYKLRLLTQQRIADRFGIAQTTVTRICSGADWKYAT